MSIASQLKERVTIQQPVTSDDGYGGKSVTWVDFATVFAEVRPVYNANNEKFVGGHLDSNAGYRIIIRARTDLTAAMRVIWKTHTLLIHSLHETDHTLNILSYEEHL